MTITTIFKYSIINIFAIIGLLGIFQLGVFMNFIKLPIVVKSHASYVADFSDDRVLMGASQHVFVGKVVKRVGEVTLPGKSPGVQYFIEIIENIKGTLKGNVLIDQEGGYQYGVMYIAGNGGDTFKPGDGYDNAYFLQPGSTYVMAVRSIGVDKNPQMGHRLGGHPNNKKLISSDPTLTPDELRTLADQDEKVASFKNAYPNEILLDVDVKNGNASNSYRTTHGTPSL